ncbi:MAG: PIN domain-containing protein [Candidatus Diapherotrites archaeon]|nr:PIN domain-containing protein [Candidatus Diapherotrites archaeon]
MIYVTDTHSFLWYLSQDKRLGKNALIAFDSAEKGEATIIVPTIVLAEAFYVCKAKGIDVKFAQLLEKIEIGWNYTSTPLDFNVIKQIQKLDKVKELHDKIIVATAQLLGAKLITKDKEITRSKYLEVIW